MARFPANEGGHRERDLCGTRATVEKYLSILEKLYCCAVWGIEIKAASSVNPSDSRGLRRLAKQTGRDFQGGIVFYDGAPILPLDRDLNLCAVPISKLWEL